ncbi:MAG: O-acetyl-ADP-ribose deacetylase [Lachnospiraceae bacterium]|nr:O-acetyl-ADP-ribose deacetylase [Lachnospiraceae bacterium]
MLNNDIIEEAIRAYTMERSMPRLIPILDSIRKCLHEGSQFIIPVDSSDEDLDQLNLDDILANDEKYAASSLSLERDYHLHLRRIETVDGKQWLVAFTSKKESGEKEHLPDGILAGGEQYQIQVNISHVLQVVQETADVEGLIINPWSQSFFFNKGLLHVMQKAEEELPMRNSLFIEQGDITKLDVDAIVNAANKTLLGGGGVDGAIHRAAGPELLDATIMLGGCKTGEAKITKGFLLKAQYIIHTVGPIYSGVDEDMKDLQNCYWNSLELARTYHVHSIAFPAISTGVYGFPKEKAAGIALTTVAKWLDENPEYGMLVVLMCYDQETYEIYQRLTKQFSN